VTCKRISLKKVKEKRKWSKPKLWFQFQHISIIQPYPKGKRLLNWTDQSWWFKWRQILFKTNYHFSICDHINHFKGRFNTGRSEIQCLAYLTTLTPSSPFYFAIPHFYSFSKQILSLFTITLLINQVIYHAHLFLKVVEAFKWPIDDLPNQEKNEQSWNPINENEIA